MSLSKGVTPSASGCHPTASAASFTASSQSGIPNAAPKYEFFTPYGRGFDLVFDFLCQQPSGRFEQGPLSIMASYGYGRARNADVFAEEQYVGTAHSLAERFKDMAPAYQHFMLMVETAATAWAANERAKKDAEDLRHLMNDAALIERVLGASGMEARQGGNEVPCEARQPDGEAGTP